MAAGQGGFNFSSFLVRWLASCFLVMATFNPSGYSYFHWLIDEADPRWSFKALIGLLLLIANLTFFLATLRALGTTGILAAGIFCLTLIWALLDHGYLHTLTPWSWVTLILLLLASIEAVGVSWSHIRARLAGQSDTIDVTL
jgi:hypothetical protein